MNFYSLQLLSPILFLFGFFFNNLFILTLNQILFTSFLVIISLILFSSFESFVKNFLSSFTVKKLLVFFALGIIVGKLKTDHEEIYSYKTTSFSANVMDIQEKNSGAYLELTNFNFVENSSENIDQFPLFPKNAQMKVKNEKLLDGVNVGNKIIAIGRMLLPITSPIPQSYRKKTTIGAIKELKIVTQNKKNIKHILRKKFEKNLSKKSASFAKAIILGDTFAISKENREPFQKAGTSHLLGVSVLNIGMLASIFYFIVRLFAALFFYRIAFYIPLDIFAKLGSLFVTFCYCLVIGFEYPVLRSLLMSSISLFAFYFGKNRTQEILLWAAAIIIAYIPSAIFDISFQLSFAAVLGLSSASKITLKNKAANLAFQTVYTTIFASIITIPLSIYHFHTTSFQPFLGNILSIPFATFVITPISLFFCILSFFDLEHLLAWFLESAFFIFSKIAEYTSPFGMNRHIDPIEIYGCFILVLCVVLFSIFKERFRYIFLIFGLGAFLLSIINKPKKPFILVHQYAVGLVLEDKIIVYPKCNFIGAMWQDAYCLPCYDGKNSKYFHKEPCGKLIVLNKIGIICSELKGTCSIKTEDHIISFAQLMNKTEQIFLDKKMLKLVL